MIRVVLLDVDGTLVDSNDLHAEAWRVALRGAGYDVPYARVRSLIGMGSDKLVPALTGLSHEDEAARGLIAARRELFINEYADRARALPGARALVERILREGQRPVVATSANSAELSLLLRRANLEDLLQTRTSSDDAQHSKPDADIVEAALVRAGVPAQEALLLGDTPYDLEAATRAGVGFVGVRCGGYGDQALHGARAIYDDPADLCDHYDGSPLAARS